MAVSATFPRCGPFPGQRIKRGAIPGGWVLLFQLEGWCGVMGEGCVIEAVIIRPAPFHFLQRVERKEKEAFLPDPRDISPNFPTVFPGRGSVDRELPSSPNTNGRYQRAPRRCATVRAEI